MSPEQASGRQAARRPDRHLLPRVRAVRDAGGRAAVHRAHGAGDHRRSGSPSAVPSVRQARPSVPEARGPGDPAGAGAGAGRPVRHGGGVRPGARSRRATGHAGAAPASPTPSRPPPRRVPPTAAGRPRRRRARRRGHARRSASSSAWACSSPGGARIAGAERERRARSVLAVLPFENLGDSADAYFADGITDEVRGKLVAGLAGSQVIARGSSNEYRHTTKAPQEIARELGADYLLTATVRWEKAPGGAEPGAGEPRAGPESSPGHAPTHQVAAAVRRLAHRRVPGAGRHRDEGGQCARRGPGRQRAPRARGQADREPGGLRRLPQRRGRLAGAWP